MVLGGAFYPTDYHSTFVGIWSRICELLSVGRGDLCAAPYGHTCTTRAALLRQRLLTTSPPNPSLQLTASREIVRFLSVVAVRSRRLNGNPLAGVSMPL